MNTKEGVIKFKCHWNRSPLAQDGKINELIEYRKKLFDLKFIGCDKNGVGYGNLSVRHKDNMFYVSGSSTGNIEHFNESHVALVTAFDTIQNRIFCTGKIKASSESLTHAAIYDSLPDIRAVIHIHNKKIWQKYLDHYPTTSKVVTYGTPEMADEIRKNLGTESEIIIMGGHEDGVLAYGKDMETAFIHILNLTT